MEKEEVKQYAKDLIEKTKDTGSELEEAFGHIKRSRGFLAILRNGRRVAKPLARQIEELSNAIQGGLNGSHKRAIAVEVIMELIPEPPWMTFFLRWLLGRAIDAAVKYWNENFSDHKWPDLEWSGRD